MTILLSLNAAAISIAGVLVASAIWLNGGIDFRAVDERSDIVAENIPETDLIDPVTDSDAEAIDGILGSDDYITTASHEFDNSSVPNGELWNESAITIYATPTSTSASTANSPTSAKCTGKLPTLT